MLFLADLVVSAVRLAEAEVRAFRRGLLRLLIGIGVLLAAMFIALIGIGFIWAFFFLLLLPPLTAKWSALVVGGAALVIAGVTALIGRQIAK